MNEDFVNLAREVFAAACRTGNSKLPDGAALSFAYLDNGGLLLAETVDTLGKELAKQFPFLRHRSLVSQQCDETARASWEASVRAVVEQLRSWSLAIPIAASKLSVLLYTMDALGLDSVDIQRLASHLDNNALTEQLHRLILEAKVSSFAPAHDRIPTAEQDIKRAAHEGNFLAITHILPHMMPEPNAVLWSAVRLLWCLAPEKLADALTVNESIFLALLVRLTLRDEFPALALRVPVAWLKYASVDDMEFAHRRGNRAYDWAALLRELLLQISESPAWPAWMNALLRAPYEGSLMRVALPQVLTSVESSHWASFIAAVNLSHSKRAARPIAEIMSAFAAGTTASAAKEMWSQCFERWNEWDYGRDEHHPHLFSPTVCAFDYPVAMYFSQMPDCERDELEASLQLAVDMVEQQWFDSSTALITERNRLLSRRRLVVHGRMLASGEEELLPPPIQAPDDYAGARYHFHDVQARY